MNECVCLTLKLAYVLKTYVRAGLTFDWRFADFAC